MVSDKIIKKVDERIFKEKSVDPFQTFGFKCDLRNEAPEELADLMTGYDQHSEDLWAELGKTMISNSDKNLKIAVVGPQGIGKTSLITDFCNSINMTKNKGQSPIAKEVSFVFVYPFKFLPDTTELFSTFFGNQKIEKMVLVFDDFQTSIYPKKENRDAFQEFEKLNNSITRLKKSLIVSTWTTFGWNYALTKIPDFPKYFDKVIYLGGLEKKDLNDMLTKRFAQFSFEEIKKPSDFFSQSQLQTIFENSSGNPRLIIDLISKSIELTSSRNQHKVTDEAIAEILSNEGINSLKSIEDSNLIHDKIFLSMLSHKRVSIETIRKFTNLERSTIQKVLENLTNSNKLLIRENNPKKPKEFLYSIKTMLRAKTESTLMTNILEQQRIN